MEVKLIQDLEPLEVSEVDNPAIGETFYFIKSEGKMNIFEKEYIEEIEKKLGKKAAEAIKNALKVLQPIFDSAPEDVKAAIATLAEAVGYGYPEPDKYPEPTDVSKNYESKLNTVERLVEKIANDVGRLSEEIAKLREDINKEVARKITKSEQEASTDIEKALDEIIVALENKAKEQEAIFSGLKNLLEKGVN